jgi:23S rRNA (cytidine1920-2'-O)/16S rRNA (cytidine1409-2'-O)-methyltransferase
VPPRQHQVARLDDVEVAAPELRADTRVVVVEGENARGLTAQRLATVSGVAERPDIVVGDLSFISLTLVLPAIVDTVGTDVPMVVLIKPQFEAGRQGIREGIVRDAAVREDAIMAVLWAASDLGLNASELLSSPIIGTGGNYEYLVVFRPGVGVHPTEWRGRAAELALTPVATRPMPDRSRPAFRLGPHSRRAGRNRSGRPPRHRHQPPG